jgi:hypothetical protein
MTRFLRSAPLVFAVAILLLPVWASAQVAAQEETPPGTITARTAALAYLADHNAGLLPPGPNAPWTTARTTPADRLGIEIYVFTNENWTVTVQYPIVRPDLTIYTVTVAGPGGQTWTLTADATGSVTEPGMPRTGAPGNRPVPWALGLLGLLLCGAGLLVARCAPRKTGAARVTGEKEPAGM